MKLSSSANPVTPGPATAYTGIKVEQTIGNLALGYQFYQSECLTIDGLVGAAYTGLDIESDLTIFPPGPVVPPTTTVLAASKSWVDPFVGVRFRYRPSENWRIFGRVDYGGWGIASDTYFQAILGGGYKISDSVGIYAAYRYLSVDYSKNAFAYDVVTKGPQIGLAFTF